MKKILILITFITFLFSQQAEITNIEIAQRTDGSKLVDIYFDITEDAVFDIFDISLEITFDQGETFTTLTQSLGDMSGLNFGTDYHIIWNFGLEYPNIELNDVQIKINATGSFEQELPFEMVTIPAGEFEFGSPFEPETINLDYDYQMMKYEVTYAQFTEFLISALNDGTVFWNWSGTSLRTQFNYNTFGFPTDEPTTIFSCINYDYSKIFFNGETLYVLEGWGNHPVVEVGLSAAVAFANYYGLRIPTAYEWEKATDIESTNIWDNTDTVPWSSDNEAYLCQNFYQSGDPFESNPFNWDDESTTPVGFFNGQLYEGFQTNDCSEPYGIYDLHGNVREWTSSKCSQTGEIIDNGEDYCLYGSSYLEGTTVPYNSSVFEWHHNSRYNGFRCVKTINN